MAKKVARTTDRSDSNGVIHASAVTNESAITMYLAALKSRKTSDNHITNSRRLLRRLANFLHPVGLLGADYEQLQSWQNSIASLDSATIAVYVSICRAFYAWWVRPMRVLIVSPAQDLVSPEVPKRRPRPVPESDYQFAVLSCADELMLSWLYLTRYAGLRCIELSTMNRDDVLDEDVGCRLRIIGKGQKERFVPISPELRGVLNPWMETQGRLFTHERGTPYRADEVSTKINNFLHGIGLPYTAHQIRHLFATDALIRSHDIRLVQELMGHSSVQTTQLYTAVVEQNGIDLAVELGVALGKLRRRSA